MPAIQWIRVAGAWVQVGGGTPPEPGSAPVITTAALNALQVGTPFTQTLAATGDTPITWAVTSGSLPAGLDMSSSGEITGTPTSDGPYTVTVSATNAAGSDSKQFSGSVSPEPEPPGGLTFWGTSAPDTTGTITLDADGGGDLRTGVRFISSVPISVFGARVWNPVGSNGTFLSTALNVFAYVENYTGAPVNGTTTFAGTPAQAKAHATTRTAGEWTEILFDTPVALDAYTGSSTSDLLTIAVEYDGGDYYVSVPYETGGNDQITSAETADVVIPSYNEATAGIHNLSGNQGRAVDMIYGVDLIFEVA